MNDPDGEPFGNAAGAPTMVYEVWSRARRDEHGTVLWPEDQPWQFHGYRVLTLNQVLRYLSFGYLVERSRSCDRNGTLPLFPRLEATYPDWGEGLD